jgi:hypothetical protein
MADGNVARRGRAADVTWDTEIITRFPKSVN